MKRTLVINIGDWSHDGHGWVDTILVTVEGDDVSDESLKNSFSKTVQRTGVNLLDVCSYYEENDISLETYESLCESGFTHSDTEDFNSIIHVNAEEDDKFFGAIELIMFYVGREISNFAWEIVEFPTLVGGFNTILSSEGRSTSFGYGTQFG